MKILILGGTGAMGKSLVRILAQAGHNVTVTSRSSHSLILSNINYVKGNARELTFLKKILSHHWDVIVDFMTYSTSEFQGRYKLLLTSTNQYIFLSSSRVYADSPLLDEKSPRLLETTNDQEYLKTDEYALAKARQETILEKSTYSNWVIVRPYITYSEERLQLGVFEKEDWLYRALHGRQIVFSRDIGRCYTTMTLGLDVAKGIASVVGKKSANKEIFQITASKAYLWQDILNLYISTLSKHNNLCIKVHWIDQMTTLSQVMQNQYQVNMDRLCNRRFQSRKIQCFCDNRLNFEDLECALPYCLDSFLLSPHFRKIDWGTQAHMDKLSQEFTPMCEIPSLKDKIKYMLFRYLPVGIPLKLRAIIQQLSQ